MTYETKKTPYTFQIQNSFERITRNEEVVYFKDIRWDPIGPVGKALRDYLPTGALRRMTFVAASVLEVVAETRLNDCKIATLTMMVIKHEADFNIYGNGLRRHRYKMPQTCKNKQIAKFV